jgi:uncharacterized coiled-coil DUF342 family protein
MSKLDRELLQLFRKVRDRVHSNLILNYGIIGAAAALGCSLLAVLLSRFIPIYAVYGKAALCVLAVALMAIVYAAFKTPGNRQVALKVDRLGLQERTLTAVELIGKENTFATLEKQDALKYLKALNFKKALPIRANRKYLALCTILVTVLTVSAFIPNPMADKAREHNQLNKEIAKQQKKITEIEKKVVKNAKLTAEQKKEAEAKLQELKKELKAAQSKKDIEKALQKAQKKLEYLSDKYTDSKENLEKLMNTLAKNQGTKQLADMIKNSSEKELKDNLKKFAEQLKKMNKEQLEQLSKDISELANQIKNNPELKQALSELAQKLGSGELGDVSDALNQLGDSISDMMSDESFSKAMQELSKQLGEMQQGQAGEPQDKAGAGKPGNGSQDGGGQQTGGQGNGNTPGQGSGQGQGQGQGKGQGGGAGSGTDMGQENPTPITPSGGIQKKDGSIKKIGEYEKIFTSKTLGGDGEQSNITGQKNNSGTTDQVTTDKSQSVRGSSVPYDQVIGEYKQQALDSINSNDIPAGMKDLIKDYFSSLEE